MIRSERPVIGIRFGVVFICVLFVIGCDREEDESSSTITMQTKSESSQSQSESRPSHGDGPPILEEAWRLESEDPKADSDIAPVVQDGVLYMVHDGAVRAIDPATGEEQWNAPMPKEFRGIAWRGGRLYVATQNRTQMAGNYDIRIHAVEPSTGNKEWMAQTDGNAAWPMEATEQRAYILSDPDEDIDLDQTEAPDDRILLVYDAETGERLRRLPAEDWSLAGEDIYATHSTVMAAKDERVIGRDLESGEVQWETDVRAESFAPAHKWKQTIVVELNEAGLQQIDLTTGDAGWSYATDRENDTIKNVVVDESAVYVHENADGTRRLVALDPDSGDQLWSSEQDEGIEGMRARGDRLTVLMDTAMLPPPDTPEVVQLLDAETGDVVWKRRTPVWPGVVPALTDNHVVFGTSNDLNFTSDGTEWTDDLGVFGLVRPEENG